MEFVSICRLFITAEQTGNWLLHLKSTQDILPYFAVAGHTNYTKCCHLYLQDAQNLCRCLIEQFENGFFTVRWNAKLFWSGTWSDKQHRAYGLSGDCLFDVVGFCIVRLCGGASRACRNGRPLRITSGGWCARDTYLILPPLLRLSATKRRLVSFLVFCETLVMFCINCCRQLSIRFTPCGLDLITVNSLDLTLCPRNVSLPGCYINNIVSKQRSNPYWFL